MPRVTKEAKDDELNKKKSTSKSSASTTKKKVATTKKSTSTKSTAKKTTNTKKTSTKTVKTSTKKEAIPVVENKEQNKKEVKEKVTRTTEKKASTTKKSTTSQKKKTSTSTKKKSSTTANKKNTKKKSATKKVENNIVAEYYDLPYRYNETIVKILYQTPTILFVYWDISDFDREQFIKQYGENFFNNTKPILKIYNLTKNYNFEVEINDFANSWYINVNDADCEYKVELGRKTIKYEEALNTKYIHVSSSNNIEFPNDRILLDKLPNKINFKNVKTNTIKTKDIGTMHLIGINKIYSAHDFYKKFYKDEILKEINSNIIINPSSSSWN